MITQTVVFVFEDQEQRRSVMDPLQAMFLSESGPQVTGLSSCDELTKSQLMFDALDRYDNHYDLRQAIEDLGNASDVSDWDWDQYDKQR